MKYKKKPTSYTAAPTSTYQTGSTMPPKNRTGLLTVALSLVIFVCGVSAILSLMRINLLQRILQQTENQTCTMAFAEPTKTTADTRSLVFQGETLDDFWRSYHDLPQGIYVTNPGGCRALQTGDVIVCIGQTPVHSWSDLETQLQNYRNGEPIPITVYRGGSQMQIRITFQPTQSER